MSHLTHFRDNLIFLYLTLSSVTCPLHRLLRPFKAFHQQRGPFYPMMGPLPSLGSGSLGVVCAGSDNIWDLSDTKCWCIAVKQIATLWKLMCKECQMTTLANHFGFILSDATRQPVDRSLAVPHWHLSLAVCSVSFTWHSRHFLTHFSHAISQQL